jgi:hypothetical protein
MVAGIAPLIQMRQFNSKHVPEHDDHEPVQKHPDRRDNGDGDDGADHQKQPDSSDRKNIPVGHAANMRAGARRRQR